MTQENVVPEDRTGSIGRGWFVVQNAKELAPLERVPEGLFTAFSEVWWGRHPLSIWEVYLRWLVDIR